MDAIESTLEPIRQFLQQHSTLSLATLTAESLPYVTPLFYLADDACRLYWFSSGSSLHSKYVDHSSWASVTVYREVEAWRDIRGVQMQGIVKQVEGRERRKNLTKQYVARFKLGSVFRMALKASNLYSFEPRQIRYLDNTLGFGYKREITTDTTPI